MKVKLEDFGQDMLHLELNSKREIVSSGPCGLQPFNGWRVLQQSIRKGMKLRLQRPPEHQQASGDHLLFIIESLHSFIAAIELRCARQAHKLALTGFNSRRSNQIAGHNSARESVADRAGNGGRFLLRRTAPAYSAQDGLPPMSPAGAVLVIRIPYVSSAATRNPECERHPLAEYGPASRGRSNSVQFRDSLIRRVVSAVGSEQGKVQYSLRVSLVVTLYISLLPGFLH